MLSTGSACWRCPSDVLDNCESYATGAVPIGGRGVHWGRARGPSQCRRAVGSRSRRRLGSRCPGWTCAGCQQLGRGDGLREAHWMPNLRPLNRLGSLSTTCSLVKEPVSGAMTHRLAAGGSGSGSRLPDLCSGRSEVVAGQSHWPEGWCVARGRAVVDARVKVKRGRG